MEWSYGVVFALSIAVVKAVEGELKAWGVAIHDRVWLYARAVVSAASVGVVAFFPGPVPNEWLIGMSIAATFLGVLGYWPEVQELGLRIKGSSGMRSLTWRR